jgi:hypothetical protein
MSEFDVIKKIKVSKLNGDVISGNKTIYNEQPRTLWDMTTEDLYNELTRCVYKKSEINRKFILPLLLALLGLGTLFISLNFKLASEFFVLILVFGIGFPMVWFAHIEKTSKSSLNFYRERIEHIKLILDDRS